MPLFNRRDPDLRSLIAHLVARARDAGVTLNQTKLVKLLYLVDVERVTRGQRPLTGLRWRFFHYGPYALELPETLAQMERRELVTRSYQRATLYASAPGAPDGEDWPPATRRAIDTVVRRYVPMELNELLDHVYFHTAPMVDARRGDWLDLERAAQSSRGVPPAPLAPPTRPADLDERLARWRAGTAKRLAPIRLDPPGRRLDVAEHDLGSGVRGRLSVPDDTAL